MYCKYCGNQINENAIACLSCGCDPRKGNQYCHSCGVHTNPNQVICVRCGVGLKNQSLSDDDGKTVAIFSYITLIGFIIAIIQHNSNKTSLGAYHLRQVIGFMFTGVAFYVILFMLTLPIFNMNYLDMADYYIFLAFISFVSWIGLLVCIIISFINALNGKETPAPIFGKLYEKWFANMFK